MKVIVAEHLGMCFGVRAALRAAHQVRNARETTIYGELVHNPQVQTEMKALGFRVAAEHEREQVPESPQVMITAHGMSHRERDRLLGNGKKLLDTICPLVHRVHEVAQQFRQLGYFVIVIGRHRHVEVRGITGDLDHFAVVERVEEVQRYEASRLGVVCQSTTAPAEADAIWTAIREKNFDKEIQFVDTICQPTKARQAAVGELLDRVEALVVVGGRNSNNTRLLAQQAEARGIPSVRVETAAELNAEQLQQYSTVGLTAGTSTPDTEIEEVHRALREIRPTPQRLRSLQDRSSARWLEYFRWNRGHLLSLEWSDGRQLSDDEKAIIGESIRVFQLGESSEGRHFIALARSYSELCKEAYRPDAPLEFIAREQRRFIALSDRFAESRSDSEYVESVKLFIAEEQRHARTLGRFMEREGIAFAKAQWTDTIFRSFRKFLNLEVCVSVLLTAEMIAMVYYRALMHATESPLLRQICRQFLRDEVEHIAFQEGTLKKIQRSRSRWHRQMVILTRWLFYCGTLLVVWGGHARVFRAGGFGFRRFWRQAQFEFCKAIRG